MASSLETIRRATFKNWLNAEGHALSQYPLEQVLTEVFQLEVAEDERPLLNEYERLAVLFWSDPHRYGREKYDHLQKLIKRIEAEGWQYPFLRLFYRIATDFVMQPVGAFLFTELSDTWDLMTLHQGKYIAGLDYDKKSFLLVDRPNWKEWCFFTDWQYRVSVGRVPRHTYAKKVGGGAGEDRYLRMIEQDNFVAKALCLVSPFITPRTLKMIPQAWMNHVDAKFHEHIYAMPTPVYKNRLKTRRYLLDRRGVKVNFQSGSLMEHVVLMEVLDYRKRTNLLFKYKMPYDIGETVGVYDVDRGLFCTYLFDQIEPENQAFARMIENFILAIYTELTCDFDWGDARGRLVEDETLTDKKVNFWPTLLYRCSVYQPPEEPQKGSRSSFVQRPHDRIHTTRKLPKGWKTSEKAKKLAADFNVKLEEGETYVQSYQTGVKPIRKEIKKRGRPRKS